SRLAPRGGATWISAVERACGIERGQLPGRGVALVLRLPLREGFSVQRFAGLVPAHVDAACLRRVAIPVGQAVATEAGEDHQVDVLHVRPLLEQVFAQAAEDGGLDLDGVFGGGVHGRSLATCGDDVRQYAFPFTASTTA